jgi:DNA-binding transcriptional LysR family regulator
MKIGYVMELRDLEYFVSVAEHGHLGRAADSLGLTHPALSKSLARLEGVMQVKLFRRSQSGMALTAEGTLLLSRARELRLSLRNVASEVTDLSRGRAGHIKIGLGPVIDNELVMSSIRHLMEESPRLAMKVVVSDGDEIEPALRSGELDVIVNFIFTEESAIFQRIPLYTDEFVVCCSREHRLAKCGQVALADLARERWTISEANLGSQRRLFDTLRAHGLAAPAVAFESRALSLRLAAAANGNLLLFTSRRIAEREVASGADLKILSVEGLVWRPVVAVMYRTEQYVHPAVLRWVEILTRITASASAEAPGGTAAKS